MISWIKHFLGMIFSSGFVMASGTATAESVAGQEFIKDFREYPCFVELMTEADKGIKIGLTDYRDIWSIELIVSNRPAVFREYFDRRDLRDERAFAEAFGKVKIGERAFDFNEIILLEVQRQKVDEETAAVFQIREMHNVAQALAAMADDGIKIQGLIELEGTTNALNEFRSCSYEAMGLSEGESVETDFRAEYRMIFEHSFELWVSNMSTAEQCLDARHDNAAVDEVIEEAAEVFYPGILNFRQRSAYREYLQKKIPFAELTGVADAAKSCMMAGQLAEASRIPVESAIKAAADLD